MGRLEGKVALVTGAGKGLGAATARVLAASGARVMCTDVDVEAGEALVSQIQDQGGEVAFMKHDVTDEASWEKVTSQVCTVFGGLHVLVNNAGVAPRGMLIEDLSLEDWRHTIAVDLDSVFLGCKYAIRVMKEDGGSIVNISSIMGMVGWSKSSDYNAAKGGVRLLTKAAAVECAENGYPIRVNSVHPGFIDTPLVRNVISQQVEEGNIGSANEMINQLSMLHPVGRLGYPDEIAKTVLFLASGDSSFMTGSEIVVDGGFTSR